MARIIDQLTLGEIAQIEILLEMEVIRMKSLGEDDEVAHNRLLELGMIKGKLNTMKRDIK